MHRTQVYITEEQRQALRRLAKSTNRGQSEIIREALDRHLNSEASTPAWKESLEALRGIWTDRPEIEQEILAARRSLDRNPFSDG